MHRSGKDIYFTSGALAHARRLRKGMTDTERKLWYYLRGKNFNGYRFRRQQPMGQYIVDFVCMKERLIIELDGSQHADRQSYDNNRDAWLNAQGFRVLRIWNNEVFENTESVMETIYYHLTSVAPTRPSAFAKASADMSATLPLEGEGKRIPTIGEI